MGIGDVGEEVGGFSGGWRGGVYVVQGGWEAGGGCCRGWWSGCGTSHGGRCGSRTLRGRRTGRSPRQKRDHHLILQITTHPTPTPPIRRLFFRRSHNPLISHHRRRNGINQIVMPTAAPEHEPVHAHPEVLPIRLQALPDEHADPVLGGRVQDCGAGLG